MRAVLHDQGMADSQLIRLATRGSNLALWQTNRIAALLTAYDPQVKVEPVIISTKPDRIQDRPLQELGGDKGLFVKEVEQAVLDGRADAAVHSLKDVPVDEVTAGLELVAFPERENPADVLLTRDGQRLEDLPPGSVVATGAPRRQAQLLSLRPDLKVCGVRGNVETRIRKLMDGEFDAIIMAAAGLCRLGLEHHITQVFTPEEFVSAPGQGIVVVQSTINSPWADHWRAIDSSECRLQAETERKFSQLIGATCYTAAGCLLEVESGRATFRGAVCSPDGRVHLRSRHSSPAADALNLAELAAQDLEQQGSLKII